MNRRGIWLVVAAAVVGVVGVLLGFAAHYDKPADFWTAAVPGVLTGVGTLALAGVTVLLATQDRRMRAKELAERESEEQLRQRREQAELIAAWFVGRYRYELSGSLMVDGFAVTLANSSQQTVYNVRVVVTLTHEPEYPYEDDTPPMQLRRDVLTLPPGRSSAVFRGEGDIGFPRGDVILFFTDRSGLHWRRAVDGTLSENPFNPIEEYREQADSFTFVTLEPEYVDPIHRSTWRG